MSECVCVHMCVCVCECVCVCVGKVGKISYQDFGLQQMLVSCCLGNWNV